MKPVSALSHAFVSRTLIVHTAESARVRCKLLLFYLFSLLCTDRSTITRWKFRALNLTVLNRVSSKSQKGFLGRTQTNYKKERKKERGRGDLTRVFHHYISLLLSGMFLVSETLYLEQISEKTPAVSVPEMFFEILLIFCYRNYT